MKYVLFAWRMKKDPTVKEEMLRERVKWIHEKPFDMSIDVSTSYRDPNKKWVRINLPGIKPFHVRYNEIKALVIAEDAIGINKPVEE